MATQSGPTPGDIAALRLAGAGASADPAFLARAEQALLARAEELRKQREALEKKGGSGVSLPALRHGGKVPARATAKPASRSTAKPPTRSSGGGRRR